jgi:hypothetical protein
LNAECGNCRYWKQKPDDHKKGQCRFYPPKVFPYADSMTGFTTAFPSTSKILWCGFHEPKLEDKRDEKKS